MSKSSPGWENYYKKNVYAVALCNFNKENIEQGLQVEKGEIFRVLEREKEWLRCKSLRNFDFNSGIVPLSYMKFLILSKSKGVQYPYENSNQNICFVIWYSIQIFLSYFNNPFRDKNINLDIFEFVDDIKYLKRIRTRILSKEVSNYSKDEIIEVINKYNLFFKIEPLFTDNNKIFDSDSIMFSKLFERHLFECPVETTNPIPSSRRNSLYIHSLNSQVFPRPKNKCQIKQNCHILIGIQSVDLVNCKSANFELYIVDINTKACISEKLLYTTLEDSQGMLRIVNFNPLITGIKTTSAVQNLSLVIKIHKTTNFIHEKSNESAFIDFPISIISIPLKDIVNTKLHTFTTKLKLNQLNNKITAEEEKDIFKCTNEEKVFELEKLYASFIFHIFRDNYEHLEDKYPEIFNHKISKIHVSKESELLNYPKKFAYLYLTLLSGYFEKFAKLTSKHMVQATITLRDGKSEIVKNAIIKNYNGKIKRLSVFRSSGTFERVSPYWNETLKIELPDRDLKSYYICIKFSPLHQRSENVIKEPKNNNVWAIIWLTDSRNCPIQDGMKCIHAFRTHFKINSAQPHPDGDYESEKSILSMLSVSNRKMEKEWSKGDETIQIVTRLVSNIYSPNQSINLIKDNIQSLMPEQIDECLKIINYAESSEICKYEEVLFKRGTEMYKNYHSTEKFEIFLKYILTLLSLDGINENTASVLEGNFYIEQIENPFFKENFIREIIDFIKSELKKEKGFVFVSTRNILENSLFIIRTYVPRRKNEGENPEYSKTITSYIDEMCKLLESDKKLIFILSKKILSFIYPLAILLDNFIPQSAILSILKKLMNIIPNTFQMEQKQMTKISFIKDKIKALSNILEKASTLISKDLFDEIMDWTSEFFYESLNDPSLITSYCEIGTRFLEISHLFSIKKMKNLKKLLFYEKFDSTLVSATFNANVKLNCEQTISNFQYVMVILNEFERNELNQILNKDMNEDFNLTNRLIKFMVSFSNTLQVTEFTADLKYKCYSIIFKVTEILSSVLLNSGNSSANAKKVYNNFFEALLLIEKNLMEVSPRILYYKLFFSKKIILNLRKRLIKNLVYLANLLEPEIKGFLYFYIPVLLESLIYSSGDEYIEPLTTIITDLLKYNYNQDKNINNTISQIYRFFDDKVDYSEVFLPWFKTIHDKISTDLKELNNNDDINFMMNEWIKLQSLIEILEDMNIPEKAKDSELLKMVKYEKLMQYFLSLNCQEHYINQLLRVVDQNKKLGCYNEAGICLERYGDILNLESSKPLPPLFNLPDESESGRKLRVYMASAYSYEQAFNYVSCIQVRKKMCKRFEIEQNYQKLEQLYEKMAKLCNLLQNEKNLIDSYYQIHFNGPNFPKYFQDKKFIFRMGYNVNLGTVMGFFSKNVSFAKVNNTSKESTDPTANVIRIISCVPKIKSSENSASSTTVENKPPICMSKSCFISNEFVGCKLNEKSNKVSVIKCLKKVEQPFPSFCFCSRVVEEKIKQLSELDQTLTSLKSSTKDVENNFSLENPHVRFKVLIMKVQGNLIANVNGGMEQILDKYFNGNYFTQNLKEAKKEEKLKTWIVNFINVNHTAIGLLSLNVSSDYMPLFNQIISSYNNTKLKLSSYGIIVNALSQEIEELECSLGSPSRLEVNRDSNGSVNSFNSFIRKTIKKRPKLSNVHERKSPSER